MTKYASFISLYDHYFTPSKEKKLRLLEIGVQDGTSLNWFRRNYPNWKVVGLDINEDSRGEDIVIGDQSDVELLYKLGSFDIVIDDGSHRMSDQITSFRTLFRLMNKGGIYAIEDIHTSYWPVFKDLGRETTVEYLKRHIDNIQNLADSRSNSNHKTENPLGITSIHFYPSIVFILK